MQTPTAARCNAAVSAVESMCARGKGACDIEVNTGSTQAAVISAKLDVAMPVNSALNLLQGVVRDSHQDP
ncbi:MAG: hypothetical protein JKY61_06925 [Planctomycetes bacterium]|nr:hypothetical protein [Planctomycetota bacterium]